jgi:hypothetical protein
MTTTSSIAELQSAGVKLEAAEAVAIAQQLIQSLKGADAPINLEPPYGPPTAATVVLDADGSVSCAACGSTPAISEIAIFLDSLLPPGSPRVPGALRYTIARALLEVDVAPFDSLDAFSASLARHELGDRAEVLRRLVRRSESACGLAVVARGDRRRPRANATDLRRALREADARLYAHHAASLLPAPPRSTGVRTMPAIAACLGAGMMLIATGEIMQRPETPKPEAAAVVAPAPAMAPATAAPPFRAIRATDRSTVPSPVATLGIEPETPETASPAVVDEPPIQPLQTAAPQRSNRVAKPRTTRQPAVEKTREERSGVLDRLTLRWLKTKFVIRADAL